MAPDAANGLRLLAVGVLAFLAGALYVAAGTGPTSLPPVAPPVNVLEEGDAPAPALAPPAVPAPQLSPDSHVRQTPSPAADNTTALTPPAFLAPITATDDDRAVAAAYAAARQRLGPAAYLAWIGDSPLPLPGWKPGRARPIVCDGREYYSGYFSIPPENIIAAVANKTKDWATVVPGRKETYVFKQEALYRGDLEISRFALTRRRYGWATNRNLEILAAGGVPFFCGIERLPPTGTLQSLPLDALRAIVHMPGVRALCFPHKKAAGYPIDRSRFNETLYTALARKLHAYTKLYQTTEHHALYVLSATSLTALPTSVLVLWASHYTIMLTGVIHGLRRLGVRVEDVPRRPEVYKGDGCDTAKAKTYAKGWFFFCRADESANLTRSDIAARLKVREWDAVIISITDTLTYHMKDPFKDVPYYAEILKAYPRDRIVTLNDADLIKPMQADVAHGMMHRDTLYFKRETHGCNERIW